MELSIKNASVGYNNCPVLNNVSFSLASGEIVCLLGSNGVGKTTVFRTMMGFIKPIDGNVFLNETDIRKMTIKDFSKVVAYVPQSHDFSFSYSVLDVVVMGCAANMSWLNSPGKKEYIIAKNILAFLGIEHLSEKMYTKISGGERQLVLIARALAQKPKLLLMDEPTANLDYGNQILIIQVLKKLKNSGLGILMTTHNPDHAFLCGDRVVMLINADEILNGGVDDIITKENLYKSYGVQVEIVTNEFSNGQTVKNCIPLLKY